MNDTATTRAERMEAIARIVRRWRRPANAAPGVAGRWQTSKDGGVASTLDFPIPCPSRHRTKPESGAGWMPMNVAGSAARRDTAAHRGDRTRRIGIFRDPSPARAAR